MHSCKVAQLQAIAKIQSPFDTYNQKKELASLNKEVARSKEALLALEEENENARLEQKMLELFLEKSRQVLSSTSGDPLTINVAVAPDNDLLEGYEVLQLFIKENILNH